VPLLRITVFGQPVVKKNNQKVGINRKTGKPVKYDTKPYKAWLKSAAMQLPWSGPPVEGPVNLACRFFMETRREVDLSNLYEGIQDLLVDRGILKDDNYKVVASHDGSGVSYDKENPRIEVVISSLIQPE
jgi:Holliday junction resolvase RusA-like endonuclease